MMYEHLVYKAKELNVSGVTVNRGIMGFGMSSTQVTTSRFWELTEKLPVVVEMVDKTEILKRYYEQVEPDLKSMKKGCLVSLGPVEILLLKSGDKGD